MIIASHAQNFCKTFSTRPLNGVAKEKHSLNEKMGCVFHESYSGSTGWSLRFVRMPASTFLFYHIFSALNVRWVSNRGLGMGIFIKSMKSMVY